VALLGSRGDATVVADLVRDPVAHAAHLRWLREHARGSELIVALRAS
jgi:hypothetical protein